MRRRAFLKAAGLGGMFACLPAVTIREGVSMDTLQKCCDPDTLRWSMASPFVDDGKVTATNSRIAIRVFDSMHIADRDNPLNIPPISQAFRKLWKPASRWSSLPKPSYEASDDTPCIECCGNGFHGVLRHCQACEGEGFNIDEDDVDDWGNSSSIDCKHCCSGFLSDRPCGTCSGKPWSGNYGGVMQMDDDLKVIAGYYSIINSLPDVRWSRSEGYGPDVIKGNHQSPVVLFKFQGGEGLCMGLRS